MRIVALLIIFVLSGVSFTRNLVWHDTVSLWEDAAAKSLNKGRPNYEAGLAFGKLGDIDKAFYHSRQAGRLHPQFFNRPSLLAESFRMQGLLDEAIKEYIKLLKTDPEQSALHGNLGSVYLEKGLLIEAVKEYLEALSINPHDAITHCNLGVAYYKMNNTKDAVREFREAIRLAPQDPEPHALLGRVYLATGMPDDAIGELQIALKIDPRHEYTKKGLDYVLKLKESRK